MERDQRFLLTTALGLFTIVIILMAWSFVHDARTKFLQGTVSGITDPADLPRPTLPPLRIEDPTTGSTDPRAVTITVFSDFTCAYCRLSEGEMIRAITELKVPVRVIWRDLPISSTSRESALAALAGRCAHAQQRFWDMHDALLTSKRLDEASLRQQAVALRLDMPSFNSCLSQGSYLTSIQKDVALAHQNLIVTSPTYFVGNEPAVTGYISSKRFEDLIKTAKKNQ